MSNFGIHIEGLSKRYGTGDTAVDALREVNMSVAPGEVVGLVGPSGSGKTTLLKCLGAVIEPTSGRMTLGAETFDIAAGDSVLIPPGTPHCIEATGSAPLRILCCCSPAYARMPS